MYYDSQPDRQMGCANVCGWGLMTHNRYRHRSEDEEVACVFFLFFFFFFKWLSKRQKGQSERERTVKSHPEALTDRTQTHPNTSEQSDALL